MMDAEKGGDYMVIMGDWNAVVGELEDGSEVGKYGLGRRNDRGDRLIEFCKRKCLMVTNTWFKQPNRRRYTWKMPGDRKRYQLDYILVRNRYRNSVKVACSYPGADVDSDHNLVAMRIQVKLKRLQKAKVRRKWNVEKLKEKDDEFRSDIEEEVQKMAKVEKDVNSKWMDLKQIILNSAGNNIGYMNRREPKKPWVTDEMIKKMDERRKWKNSRTPEGKRKYKELNNELRRSTDQARNDWWIKQCEELEELDRKGRSDLMYAKVKEVTVNKKINSKSNTIKDKDGNLLTEAEDIQNRWKEYTEILYDKEGKPKLDDMDIEKERDVQSDEKGPSFLRGEILLAIKELKNKKSAGIDNIPAEMLKNLGEKATEELVEMCQMMYEKGEWPDDFTKTIVVPMEKKTNAVECSDFRTISLIPHASKIILKILTKRIVTRSEEFLGRNQFGFRKGCGTREAIGVMRMLCEKILEHDNDLFFCFVDFEKAFDRVKWTKLMDILKKIGIDWRDR